MTTKTSLAETAGRMTGVRAQSSRVQWSGQGIGGLHWTTGPAAGHDGTPIDPQELADLIAERVALRPLAVEFEWPADAWIAAVRLRADLGEVAHVIAGRLAADAHEDCEANIDVAELADWLGIDAGAVEHPIAELIDAELIEPAPGGFRLLFVAVPA